MWTPEVGGIFCCCGRLASLQPEHIRGRDGEKKVHDILHSESISLVGREWRNHSLFFLFILLVLLLLLAHKGKRMKV